jgi:hypothetical protein
MISLPGTLSYCYQDIDDLKGPLVFACVGGTIASRLMARGPADLSLHEPNKFKEPPSGKGQTAPLPSEVKAKTAEFKGQDGNEGTQQLGKAKGKITGIRLVALFARGPAFDTCNSTGRPVMSDQAYNELKSLDGLDEALSAGCDCGLFFLSKTRAEHVNLSALC